MTKKKHSDMLQNDTFCIFLSFHSTSCFVFLETLDAEKKKHWGRGECDSGSEWHEREQNWRNETGFIQVCLFFFLVVAFVRVFLLLPSVAVAWFGVVKSRWGGSIASLRLSSHSLHLVVLSVCLHRFFGGGAVRGGVTGRPAEIPPYWYFAFFSEGFRI